jgi:hypothetical protein
LDDLIDLGVSWLRKPQYDSSCFLIWICCWYSSLLYDFTEVS